MNLITRAKGLFVPRRAPLSIAAPAVIRQLGRHKTCDVAFNLRMGAGSPGDITRHAPPGTIEPCYADPANPPTQFGVAVMADLTATNGVRNVVAGDNGGTSIYGITVRPYPIQQGTTANYSGAVGFGGGGPAPGQPLDVLRSGYILGYINGVPQKGGPVFVWVAASTGSHIQGTFEIVGSGGNTIALDSKSTFSAGVDANSNGEICFNI